MLIDSYVKKLNFEEKFPCVLLLGGFDGVHKGHESLLLRAKTYHLPVGIMSIEGGKGEDLFTREERKIIFDNCGADFCFSFSFQEIKEKTAKEFADFLLKSFDVKRFVCGEDFCFGLNRQGTPTLLSQYTGVETEVAPLLTCENGEKISSSTIKKYLKLGDIESANKLLYEKFFLFGEVVKDRGVGRTIGFPTANILYPSNKYPLKEGVYESVCELDGKLYSGITNYGSRPTFGEKRVVLETYFDGYSGNLYGKEIKVEFVRFLRDDKKFSSVEELKAQLETDLRRVKKHD